MRLVILGAGGHGCMVASIAESMKKYDKIIFLDDHYIINKVEQLEYGPAKIKNVIGGKCSEYVKYIDENTEIYPAFGNNETRLKWQNEIVKNGGQLPTIIHSSSCVSKNCEIKEGSIIFQNVTINSGCVIERGCIINTGTIIDHGCHICSGVHINIGAIVMAENKIPPYTNIKAGQIVGWRYWPVN